MTKKKRFGVSQALTRGLSETIHVVENNAGIFRNAMLPLSRIELDPNNPRKLAISLTDVVHGLQKDDPQFDQKSAELDRLKELAMTIESSGVINPVVVYKRGEVYRVVAGERRCLASILAGKQEIEARVFNEKPRGYALKLVQWIENTAREDLRLDERLDNIREIIHEYQQQHGECEVTATLLKNIIGLSLPQATYYLHVLKAPQEIQDAILLGRLQNLDKAAVVASIVSPVMRSAALVACLNGCSLKDLRKMIAHQKEHKEQVPAGQKRGRAAARINMGFTIQPNVVEAIVQAVLHQEEYKKYHAMFSNIEWQHYDQATMAFRKLVKILEQERVR